ncbi:MAG: cache domain-containing protein [Treponema sp.]
MREKKIFSIRKKLLIIFGTLITVAGVIQGSLSRYTAQRALTARVNAHLIDKVNDIALFISSDIKGDFSFLSGFMRNPAIKDPSVSFTEKTRIVRDDIGYADTLSFFNICDTKGNSYYADGTVSFVGDTDWYKSAVSGVSFITEPHISTLTKKLEVILAVPLLDNDDNVIAVLGAGLGGTVICDTISEITIGKTGNCHILGMDGTTIAHKDTSIVESQQNTMELAKTDRSFASIAEFQRQAISSSSDGIGYYTYDGKKHIAAYTKMPDTKWTIIIAAPAEEFLGAITDFRKMIIIIGVIILAVTLTIVFFIAAKMVAPVQTAVNALKDISQGEGDLTVQLPLIGNDEVTRLSEYFNETIKKIRSSIQSIDSNAGIMRSIGDELAQNMTETAQAVHKINENIDGVKQQALTQTASVGETAATVEEIIKTIRQ